MGKPRVENGPASQRCQVVDVVTYILPEGLLPKWERGGGDKTVSGEERTGASVVVVPT